MQFGVGAGAWKAQVEQVQQYLRQASLQPPHYQCVALRGVLDLICHAPTSTADAEKKLDSIRTELINDVMAKADKLPVYFRRLVQEHPIQQLDRQIHVEPLLAEDLLSDDEPYDDRDVAETSMTADMHDTDDYDDLEITPRMEQRLGTGAGE
jgi:hypothetical protein